MSKNRLVRLVRFLRRGVWDAELRRLSPARRAWVAFLRVVSHVVRSFSQNLVGLQAAGLTLVTLLAMVPTLALVFAVGKALGYAQRLESWLVELGQQLPAEAQGAVEQIRVMVAGVDFRTIGVVGSLVMVWTGLMLFTRVEQALNGIWRTRQTRPWVRRISDFIALVVLVPPLALLALVGSSVLGGVALLADLRAQSEWLAWLYEAGLGFVPHVLLWIAFGALYKILPSARVPWRFALLGGIVAGSSLVVLHGLYLRLQVGVAQANAIYATLAALPVLLIYLQLVWTVVLGGAEIAYAAQHHSSLHPDERLPPPTWGVRVRIAWHLLDRASAAFRSGQKGVRPAELCAELDLPADWVGDVADLLVQDGLLMVTQGDEELLAPGRPPESIAMPDVLAVLEGRGSRFLGRVRLPDGPEARLAAASQAASREVAEVAF